MITVNLFSLIDLAVFSMSAPLALVFYVVYARLGRRRVDLIFANILLSTTVYAFAAFMVDNATAPLPALIWTRIASTISALTMVFVIHFLFEFLGERGPAANRIITAVYVVGFVVAVLTPSPHFLQSRVHVNSVRSWTNVAPWLPETGTLQLSFVVFWFSLNIYAIYKLCRKPMAAQARQGRLRGTRPLLIGFLVLIGSGALDTVLVTAHICTINFGMIGILGVCIPAAISLGQQLLDVQRFNRIVSSSGVFQEISARVFNPYIAGKAVPSEMFFGREDLVRRILSTIHNNCVFLHGERRIGKTSFQRSLQQRLSALNDPEFQFIPVFVDMQGMSEGRFFAVLMERIVAACRSAGILPADADRMSALRSAGFQPADADRMSALQEYTDLDFELDISTLIESLQACCPKKVKLVLLLDEVDTFNGYSLQTCLAYRRLFMGLPCSEHLVTVMSGYALRQDWGQEGSPPFNYLVPIEMKGFSDEEARALIEQPVKGNYTYEPAAVRAIIELSERRPFVIQLLCQRAVEYILKEGRRRITVADIAATQASALTEAHAILLTGTSEGSISTVTATTVIESAED